MSASKNTAGVSIPEEIVFEILSKLPAKTLVRFRCVSKLICALIADHAFGVLNRSLSLTLPDKAPLIINSALLQVGGRLALVHVRFPELGGEGLCYMNVWTWEKSKKCWKEITITIPLKWSRMINKVRVWSRMTNKVRLLRYATNHDGEIVLLCVYSEKLSVLIYNMKSEAWRNFDVSGVEDVLIFNSEEEDSSEVTLHNIEDHVFPLE
nr:putative F-box protein At3g52320 [Ipomoea batatas]